MLNCHIRKLYFICICNQTFSHRSSGAGENAVLLLDKVTTQNNILPDAGTLSPYPEYNKTHYKSYLIDLYLFVYLFIYDWLIHLKLLLFCMHKTTGHHNTDSALTW